jgi:hypothetical protein
MRFSEIERRSIFNFYNTYPIPIYLKQLKRFLYDNRNNIFDNSNVKKSIMLRKIKIGIKIKIDRI